MVLLPAKTRSDEGDTVRTERRRRIETREDERSWWVSIPLLKEMTRADGGDTVWSARVVVLGGGVRSVVGFDWWWVPISGGFRSFLSNEEDDQTTTKTEDRWWRISGGGSVAGFDRSPLLSFFCDREHEKKVRGEKKVRQKKKIQKKNFGS